MDTCNVVCLPLHDRRDRSLSLRRFFFSLRVLFLSSSFKWRLPASSHERTVFQTQMDSSWPSNILSSVSDIGYGYATAGSCGTPFRNFSIPLQSRRVHLVAPLRFRMHFSFFTVITSYLGMLLSSSDKIPVFSPHSSGVRPGIVLRQLYTSITPIASTGDQWGCAMQTPHSLNLLRSPLKEREWYCVSLNGVLQGN